MKKQYLSALCGVVFALLGIMATQAYDFEVDGIYYNVLSLDDMTCEVTRDDSSSDYSPGGTYEGAIIHVPETVTYSGRTFTVTAIGDYAFAYSENLLEVTLPETITRMGSGAFQYCVKLTSFVFPPKMTEIASCLLQGCESIKELTVPNHILCIGSRAFSDTKMEKCIIEDGENVIRLEKTKIYSVGSSGEFYYTGVFDGADIKYLYVGRNYNYMTDTNRDGSRGFIGMDALEEVVIGPYVTSLLIAEPGMFVTCSFGEYGSNSNFKRLTILPGKSSVENQIYLIMSADALDFQNIQEFSFGKNVYVSLYNMPNLVSVNLNGNCSQIEEYFFAYCYKLTRIEISSPHLAVGRNAFLDTPELATIVCRTKTPPTFDDDPGFSNNQYMYVEVFVPEDALAVYQANDVWGKFWNLKSLDELPVVTGIKLNAASVTLNSRKNETFQLEAIVLPENAFYKSITWSSSNEDVAIVSPTGLVEAQGKVGTATITATCENVTATCEVTVTDNTGLETLLQDPDAEFAVYNVQGILVQQKCTPDELRNLPKGIYILASEKGQYKVAI